MLTTKPKALIIINVKLHPTNEAENTE